MGLKVVAATKPTVNAISRSAHSVIMANGKRNIHIRTGSVVSGDGGGSLSYYSDSFGLLKGEWICSCWCEVGSKW